MSKTNVLVIGDGGWGTALATVLHGNGCRVKVWGAFPDYIETVKKTGENKDFLPGIKLPSDMLWTSDRKEAVEKADIMILAVPSRYYSDVVKSFSSLMPRNSVVVSVAKGLDAKSHRRMSAMASEILSRDDICVLSGPSHAEEVARGIPTAVVVGGKNQDHCSLIQKTFSNNFFRVYTSDDVVGVELGGALKNVIALAVGVSDGLGFGDNTRAALITRGLAEITRLGCAFGARQSTFAGLSGTGDLIVTCTSRLSRNRNVGERIGKGEKAETILGNMKQVAEGVHNCRSAYEMAKEAGIETPITNEVYQIIHKDKDPRSAVTSLMTRDVKPEAE